MKKIFLLAGIIILFFITDFFAQISPNSSIDQKVKILGSWSRRGFYYSFDDKGVMKAAKIDGNPIGYRQYNYSLFKMGANTFIEYGETNRKIPRKLMLIDDIRDSTMAIAFGTSFIRADSTDGMIGTWKRTREFRSMIWEIEPMTVRYSETYFDINTKRNIIIDQRNGTYKREPQRMSADAKELTGGRFHIRFNDGRKSIILPVLFDGLMYLFDLSPAKAKFHRVHPDSIPTYKEYKAEQERRRSQNNTVSQKY